MRAFPLFLSKAKFLRIALGLAASPVLAFANSLETASVQPSGLVASTLPSEVSGVKRQGSKIVSTTVKVKSSSGTLSPSALPEIAVIHGAHWSPNDSQRDGAGEIEILLCAARLVNSHPLSGVVGIGNSHGTFIPSTDNALQMTACMGIPVARLGRHLRNDQDLFIEAGATSPEEARRLLAICLLRYGAPSPAADPAHPSASEATAIRAKVRLYQSVFDTEGSVRVAME